MLDPSELIENIKSISTNKLFSYSEELYFLRLLLRRNFVISNNNDREATSDKNQEVLSEIHKTQKQILINIKHTS